MIAIFRNLILIVVCSGMLAGGSFTCRASTNSDDFTSNPSTGAGK